MKIALFGGAFNPIGEHHINIANRIINSGIVDEVWIMPCYKSMSNKKLEDGYHRLNMCHIAIHNNNKIKVCDFEIKHKLIASSYEILEKFYKEYNNGYQFYFLIGADNAINIEKWPDYDKTLQMISFIVLPRGDVKINDNAWCCKQPHQYLKSIDIENGSSTEIRNDIKSNNKSNLIFEEINKYINEYNLYKSN